MRGRLVVENHPVQSRPDNIARLGTRGQLNDAACRRARGRCVSRDDPGGSEPQALVVLRHQVDPDALAAAWGRVRNELRSIENGEIVGELEQTENQRNALFKHGSDSRTTITDRLFKATDEL